MAGRLRTAAALACLSFGASGCATLLGYPPSPPSAEDIARTSEKMAALPRAAQAEIQVRAAVEQIAAAASAITPELRWTWSGDRVEAACAGTYGSAGGIGIGLPRLLAEGSVPADAWPAFQDTARDIARTVGADDMSPGANPPHYHVGFEGSGDLDGGNTVSLNVYSSPGSMTITASTGCRLP
ncbi:LppA family lipoprotein [Nocardia takedensis]|uniref:LppA family lipoprotein n=1 Tax=Nocardia takedensis TaxID=259390 RepID=UPI000A04EF29|nr:LppA family lipoprotein [Nocardia takedensis]